MGNCWSCSYTCFVICRYIGVFGFTPELQKQLHSTSSTNLSAKHVQLHKPQLRKKVESRARSAFLLEYIKRLCAAASRSACGQSAAAQDASATRSAAPSHAGLRRPLQDRELGRWGEQRRKRMGEKRGWHVDPLLRVK
jgi:hypothetical protein